MYLWLGPVPRRGENDLAVEFLLKQPVVTCILNQFRSGFEVELREDI